MIYNALAYTIMLIGYRYDIYGKLQHVYSRGVIYILYHIRKEW